MTAMEPLDVHCALCLVNEEVYLLLNALAANTKYANFSGKQKVHLSWMQGVMQQVNCANSKL